MPEESASPGLHQFLERAGGHHLAERQLQVLIKLRNGVLDLMPCRYRIGDPELGDERDADADLVTGQDLLTLDGLTCFANVDHIDVLRLPGPRPIASGREDLSESPPVVEQASLVLTNDPLRHRLPPDPGTRRLNWDGTNQVFQNTAVRAVVVGDPRGFCCGDLNAGR